MKNLVLAHRIKKALRIKKYFKKIKKSISKAKFVNNTIDTLDIKYKKFKN